MKVKIGQLNLCSKMESQINLELLKKSMQPIKRELEAKEDLSKIARTEFIPYDKSSNWRDLI